MRTDAHTAEKIVQEIQSLFPAHLFEAETEKSPFYHFSCDEDEHVLYKIVEILRSLHNLQNEWADDIPGFSVLLQKGGLLQKSRTKNRIGSEVFLLPEENGIWCTAVTADIISHFVHFEQVESYYRIVDFERETLSPQDSPKLCAEDSLCDRLIDLILEADIGSRKLPVIFGAQYTGKRLLIHLVLQALEAGMGGIEWCAIDYFPALGSVYSALLHRLDEKVLAEAQDFLSSQESVLWEELQSLNNMPVTTWSDTDIKLFFQLYLKAYTSRMRRELLPPVVVIHGFDEYPEEVRKFLALQIDLLVRTGEGIPVITLRKESTCASLEKVTETVLIEIEEWHSKLQEQFGAHLTTPYEAYEYSGDPPRRRNRFGKAPEELHTVLYTCFNLRGLLDKDKLLELFQQLGLRREVVEQSLYQLKALGYLGRIDFSCPPDPLRLRM
ncbi:MAG: hypothetical protein U5P10_08950 [Spirochaetia bacterium]|nr:hypothetical protein [Spirochaetia bacterium]